MTPRSAKLLPLLGLTALILTGCATGSSGTIAGLTVPADSTVAIFSTPNYPYDGIDLDGSFLRVLRKYGLTPTSKGDAPFVLQIGFTQPEPATIACSLVLLDRGRPVISVRATRRDLAAPDPGAPGEKDREAADRAAAFLAAREVFEVRARDAQGGKN